MDAINRSATPDLAGLIERDARSFSFFRVTRLLLEMLEHQVEEEALRPQAPSNMMFLVNPELGFPASDVQSVRIIENDEGGSRAEMKVNFLGLHGSSSPLPSHFIESVALYPNEVGVQETFYNFFSNRLIWLFYLVWRKYRYHERYLPNAEDQFSNWMFSLIGIGGKEARGASDIPWAKLLTYLGVISTRTRSPQTLAGVISHSFDVDDVKIEQFCLRIVEIPKDQRVKLGQRNSTIGGDFCIGSRVKDIAGKFVVDLRELSFSRFQDFLPSGKDHKKLRDLVEFLLRDQLAYDFRLNLAEGQTPDFQLGDEDRGRLGWTSFIGNAEQKGRQSVLLTVRN